MNGKISISKCAVISFQHAGKTTRYKQLGSIFNQKMMDT